jgi:hypothetical protein
LDLFLCKLFSNAVQKGVPSSVLALKLSIFLIDTCIILEVGYKEPRWSHPVGPAVPGNVLDIIYLRLVEEQQLQLKVEVSYSATEALRAKDFADFDADEMEQVRALLALLRPRIERRMTPRKIRGRGRRIDLRRTLRNALRTGGEPLVLPCRERKQRQRPLVVLCDISGSMDRYSRVLLQFVYAITSDCARSRRSYLARD